MGDREQVFIVEFVRLIITLVPHKSFLKHTALTQTQRHTYTHRLIYKTIGCGQGNTFNSSLYTANQFTYRTVSKRYHILFEHCFLPRYCALVVFAKANTKLIQSLSFALSLSHSPFLLPCQCCTLCSQSADLSCVVCLSPLAYWVVCLYISMMSKKKIALSEFTSFDLMFLITRLKNVDLKNLIYSLFPIHSFLFFNFIYLFLAFIIGFFVSVFSLNSHGHRL